MDGFRGDHAKKINQKKDKYQMISLRCGIERKKLKYKKKIKTNPWHLTAKLSLFQGKEARAKSEGHPSM